MKIALIAPSYIPSRRANTIQTMKMSQAITQLGHQVLLLVPGENPSVAWEELSQHYGLKTKFKIEWIKAVPRWRRYDFAINAVRRARQWGAEMVYTRVPQSAAIASTFGMATIFEIHDFPGGRIGPLMVKRFLKGKGAKSLVSITQALATDLAVAFNIPESFIEIAPDGVDLERYKDLPSASEARRQIGLDDIFTVGYTGHLYPGRGSKLIVEIAEGIPEVNFLLVGGDPKDITNVQAQVEAQGLKNTILTGFISNTKLPLYQAACDILLMPYQEKVSASSGGNIARYLSPMKMFEYLASERVIISSNLPVLQEVLNAENAVILPINNVSAWIDEVRKLQGDIPRRSLLAKNARKTAEQFSWQARAKQVISVLK